VVKTTEGPACVECIYEGALRSGWQESGTAARQPSADRSARVRFGASGDWTLRRTGLSGRYGALAFRVWSPPGEGDFLELHLATTEGKPAGPAVKLKPDHRSDIGDGWAQVVVPMGELDPTGAPFDRVVFRSFRAFEPWVLFDKIGFTGSAPPSAPAAQAGTTAAAAPAAARNPAPATAGDPPNVVRTRIACDAPAARISPYIYGIAYGDADWPLLGARARRWGGNPSTRYNWEGNFNNRGADWFFENKGGSGTGWAEYLAEGLSHGAPTALTVPTIGWVAKDAKSYPFSVAKLGAQQKTDPWAPDVGNGVSPSGTELKAGPPTDTSVEAPPAFIKRWVAAIVASDAKTGKRSVYEYILDNEPNLWYRTHRDVRPEPLGYDELLDRTIQYGTAIRAADRDALIAGPAEWGFTNYFDSSKDTGAKVNLKLDRVAHGNAPLVEWYLRKLREHEQKNGVRVLDVLDLHYYPQGSNVYSAAADRPTQLLRLRSTRSLWDETYVDESWIKEPVRLLPRMKEWVEKNYPGLGISIGEWSFGGEGDITGALATAEALGRFAQFGVTSAFYWTAPPAKSESAAGFRAYRDFDGKGGHFLDLYVPSDQAQGASFFASREADGSRMVVVALNLSPDTAQTAQLDLSACGTVESHQEYTHVQGTAGLSPSGNVRQATTTVERSLPPWSIVVFDIRLRPKK
jgi:hypothetical protein